MKSQKSALLLLVTACAMMTQVSNAVYFYAAENKWRCFSDTVVKNNVSGLITEFRMKAKQANLI